MRSSLILVPYTACKAQKQSHEEVMQAMQEPITRARAKPC